MTGNSEEGGAGEADWLAAMQTALMAEVAAAIQALPDVRPTTDGGSAGLDRHARAIINLARAARAAAGLTETAGRTRHRAAGEDMGKRTDDVSPDELARVREEFAVRLDRFHAALEQKRVDDGAVAGPVAGPEPGPGAKPRDRAA